MTSLYSHDIFCFILVDYQTGLWEKHLVTGDWSQSSHAPNEDSTREFADWFMVHITTQPWKKEYLDIYTERKKKRRVEFFPSYFNHFLRCLLLPYTLTDCPVNVNHGYTSLWSMCYIPSVWNHSTVHYTVHCTDNTESQNFVQNKRVKTFSTRFPHTIWYTSTIHNALRFFYRFFFSFLRYFELFSIMVRLTDVQSGRAIALLMQGQRQHQVSNHFGVNVSTIERLVRRLRETGHLADRPRSGRPRVTSRRQDRTIRLAHLRNRHLTASETALNTVGTHNRQISPKTVGSRLREIGLRARRPYVGLPLTQARRLRRMALLTAHAPRLFPMRQWRRVLLRTSLGLLSIAQMVDVVCTDVAENALPTPVLSNGIGLRVAPLWSGEALLMG